MPKRHPRYYKKKDGIGENRLVGYGDDVRITKVGTRKPLTLEDFPTVEEVERQGLKVHPKHQALLDAEEKKKDE